MPYFLDVFGTSKKSTKIGPSDPLFITKWGSPAPTQATGPPRSGAGVGVGMLRGVGIPLLENVWISRIHQDSTIVNFRFVWKALGEDDRSGPKKIKPIQTYSIFFQKYVRFNRIYLCLKMFRFPKLIKIPPS